MNTVRFPRVAFSLVEVTLALGIAAFCLLAIFGLFPVGLNSNRASIEQTAAINLSSSVIADLLAIPAGSQSPSPRYGFSIPLAGTGPVGPATIYLRSDGTPGGAVGAAPSTGPLRYRVTAWFTPPASAQKSSTQVRVLVTWPAMADSNPAATPTRFSGSYEAVTALDRN